MIHDDLAPALKVQRHPERAVADRDVAFAILDEALICHVGFVVDGRPWVIPTMYARDGEVLYLHGSPASRMLRNLADGIDVSVTVTLLDGLVLARSVFSHSMNYRSVVIAGMATEVIDPDVKLAAMRSLVEHVLPGRWAEVRGPSAKEMRTTLVLALPLDHLSTKVRTGPPSDLPADRRLPTWAGEIPVGLVFGTPQADALVTTPALPGSVAAQAAKRVRANQPRCAFAAAAGHQGWSARHRPPPGAGVSTPRR